MYLVGGGMALKTSVRSTRLGRQVDVKSDAVANTVWLVDKSETMRKTPLPPSGTQLSPVCLPHFPFSGGNAERHNGKSRRKRTEVAD